MNNISGWGRYPIQSCQLIRPEKLSELHAYGNSCIARGQGRSYGDASLNQNGIVILTEKLNNFIEFDSVSGILTADAGMTLAEILPVITAKNWFLPVTPGTQYVSLGGCVASDVHGKNHHHDGSFGDCIVSLELILADNSILICNPDQHADIFWATVGGMGLTGIIKTVTLQLIKINNILLNNRNILTQSISELMDVLESKETEHYKYSVAWLDLLSRNKPGILMLGEHNKEDINKPYIYSKKIRNIPVSFNIINKPLLNLYNKYVYYSAKKKDSLIHYQPYFYPLDTLKNWNNLYGKKGFIQYQCVVPSRAGMEEILRLNPPSFLTVLKKLRQSNKGLLSFPMEGFTLAMDMRWDKKWVEKLDDIVLAQGGRVYLAKDACLSAPNFRRMYPEYEKFLNIKHKLDPHNIFQSSLSRRLEIMI